MSLFQGFTDQFHKELREEIALLDSAILSGNIANFEEYKRLIGRRSGFLRSLERHTELTSMMLEHANDD